MASKGLYSAAGTCSSAAAWTTTSTVERARQPLPIPNVPDEEPQPRIGADLLLELVLLEFVAAEDDHTAARM
jgi:hypothetical protein